MIKSGCLVFESGETNENTGKHLRLAPCGSDKAMLSYYTAPSCFSHVQVLGSTLRLGLKSNDEKV